jgi:hypothetical protein
MVNLAIRGALLVLAITIAIAFPSRAIAFESHHPVGYGAIGYPPPGTVGRCPCGALGCSAFPYCTSSSLYGYQDHAYGRGPLINLGGAALQPGFRGYGMFGSPGYGLGLYPSTWIDQRAPWKHRLGLGHQQRAGH